MLTFLIFLLAILSVTIFIVTPILVIVGIPFLALYFAWTHTSSKQVIKRTTIVLIGVSIAACPYILLKIRDRDLLMARVPEPLQISSVEFRLEESWGIGGPGDNETGFVVYRLTPESAQWTREQGSRPRELLPGGGAVWHPTPVGQVGDHKQWHHYDDRPEMMSFKRPEHHPPTIFEYIEKYGFLIPIDQAHSADADQAIQNEGSFYSYGRGGSVTIVDPARGKVYFAYAG